MKMSRSGRLAFDTAVSSLPETATQADNHFQLEEMQFYQLLPTVYDLLTTCLFASPFHY